MKSLLAIALVASLGLTAEANAAEPAAICDVSAGAYYERAVSWLVAQGITRGTSRYEFSPDGLVSRGQMAVLLHRRSGEPAPGASTKTFEDVASSAYYFDAVSWLVSAGITHGTTPTRFEPDAPLSRGQMAVFLWRAAGSPPVDPSDTAGFTDVKSADYYSAAIAWMAGVGITTGTSANTFSPGQSITRGQMAMFLWRAAGEPAAVTPRCESYIRQIFDNRPDTEMGSRRPQISDDGKVLAFSYGLNAFKRTVDASDVYIWDADRGVERLTKGDRPSWGTLSADGTTIAITSQASNLTSTADVNGFDDLFLWRRGFGITQITHGNGSTYGGSVSDDGKTVAFISRATDLTADADKNGHGWDIFVWREGEGVSRITNEVVENHGPILSGDGSTIAWQRTVPAQGEASEVFVWKDGLGITKISDGPFVREIEVSDSGVVVFTQFTDPWIDVFMWHPETSTVSRITSGDGYKSGLSISGDGRRVVYVATAEDLVPPFPHGSAAIYMWSDTDDPELIANCESCYYKDIAISDDGLTVAYQTMDEVASLPGGGFHSVELVLWNRSIGTESLARINEEGSITYEVSGELGPVLSADGKAVGFVSNVDRLVTDSDTDGREDLFLWKSLS